MAFPLATQAGNGNLLVDASGATGASPTSQFIDVALGKACVESLADITNAFTIRRDALTGTTGRFAFRLQTAAAVNLLMDHSFLQNGINEGDTILLVDV